LAVIAANLPHRGTELQREARRRSHDAGDGGEQMTLLAGGLKALALLLCAVLVAGCATGREPDYTPPNARRSLISLRKRPLHRLRRPAAEVSGRGLRGCEELLRRARMRIALADYCWQQDAEARRDADLRDGCLNAYWDAQERAATPSPRPALVPPEDPPPAPAALRRLK
jgi:hypothetical protein